MPRDTVATRVGALQVRGLKHARVLPATAAAMDRIARKGSRYAVRQHVWTCFRSMSAAVPTATQAASAVAMCAAPPVLPAGSLSAAAAIAASSALGCSLFCCGDSDAGTSYAGHISSGAAPALSAAEAAEIDLAAAKFRAVVGAEHVSLAQDDLTAHGNDNYSYHTGTSPHLVVYPQTTEQVSKLLAYCNARSLPVIPYGSGTSLEGHTTAPFRGVCIDVSQMNRVLEVRPGDMDATVQPGVTWNELNEHLQETETGMFFAMDPGPGASVGGMVATGCSGTNAVRFGTMKANVLNVTVVLADGTVVKTAQRARKTSAGYDLTSLFVGSEGTLGIVTEITVKLANVPEETVVASCSFASIHEAAEAVHEVMRKGVQIRCVELLDTDMMRAVNKYTKSDHREAPTLFFKLTGSTTGVQEHAKLVQEIVSRHHGGNFVWTSDPEERDALWEARKTALWAAPTLKEGSKVWTTDVCVPLSRMADCIVQTKEDIAKSHLVAPLVGHVGDGNFHVFFLLDPSNKEDMAEAQRLNARMVRRAIEMEGTCTGEHGVGVGKTGFLREELGDANVATMWAIKRALDPKGIMNPGKLLPAP